MRVQLLEDQISLKRISSSFQYFGDMGQDVWSLENQVSQKFQYSQTSYQKIHPVFKVIKHLFKNYILVPIAPLRGANRIVFILSE